jgi:hypothetical protein
MKIGNMHDYFIEGLYLRNLLSFDELEIRDFKRVNVFVGENSSGKSNIIRAMIGFMPGGTEKSAERHIDFYDNYSITEALNKSDYKDCYFEIPPFRNLVVPEGIPISRENWRSGIVDLRKIRAAGEDFYGPLRKIIDIEDFSLCGYGLSQPPIFFDKEKNGCLNGERWTNCGYYYRRIDGKLKELPIDLLGWGTKSVIIIYYNLFFNPKSLVFIEEPEISTHPALLKALFDWIFHERPDCQFFITTHSSLLIDRVFLGEIEGGVKLMSVYRDRDRTRVKCLDDQMKVIRTLEQLGYKGSNLLFTNYVIWVEGISDIRYYEALLALVAALEGTKLMRGVHYELMAFGGSIERHLFDVKSPESIPLILSFGRRGAVFCDYDNDKKKTRNRLERLKKARGKHDFKIGATGAMLKTSGEFDTETKAIPCTIENVMSTAVAKDVFGQFYGKKKTEACMKKISNNEKVCGIDKEKILLGEAFLKYVNEKMSARSSRETDHTFVKQFISDNNTLSEALIKFFERLVKEIRAANA